MTDTAHLSAAINDAVQSWMKATSGLWNASAAGSGGEAPPQPEDSVGGNAFIAANRAAMNSFLDFTRAGLEQYAAFQKNGGGLDSTLQPWGTSEFKKRAFDVVSKIWQEEFQKLLGAPKVGLMRSYQEKISRMMEKSSSFHTAFVDFADLLMEPLKKSFQGMACDAAQASENENQSGVMERSYEKWIHNLERHYAELLSSSEYLDAMKRTLDTMEDFTDARQTIFQDVLKISGLPSRKDMDELYKDLYLLKKRISILERESRQE